MRKLTDEDLAIESRFEAVEMDEGQFLAAAALRDEAKRLTRVIRMHTLPGRNQSIALTQLEGAMHFAVKAVVRTG